MKKEEAVVVYHYEPENYTVEYGLKVGVSL
jgi:hypothetical protein